MRYSPYFLFNGTAEEATLLYAKAFDGETQIMKFKDAPPNPDFPLAEEMKELVMHSEVRFGDIVFMISDSSPMQPVTAGNNVQVCITFDDNESFEKTYHVLSVDGKIIMPAGATFFAENYAMFEDKFGVTWQLIVTKAM